MHILRRERQVFVCPSCLVSEELSVRSLSHVTVQTFISLTYKYTTHVSNFTPTISM